jgi:hypothetical protein
MANYMGTLWQVHRTEGERLSRGTTCAPTGDCCPRAGTYTRVLRPPRRWSVLYAAADAVTSAAEVQRQRVCSTPAPALRL